MNFAFEKIIDAKVTECDQMSNKELREIISPIVARGASRDDLIDLAAMKLANAELRDAL